MWNVWDDIGQAYQERQKDMLYGGGGGGERRVGLDLDALMLQDSFEKCHLDIWYLLRKTQGSINEGGKHFWNPFKPCHVGILWILSLSSLRWVPMCQGFNHLSGFLHHFVLAKLATSCIRAKDSCWVGSKYKLFFRYFPNRCSNQKDIPIKSDQFWTMQEGNRLKRYIDKI